MVTTPSKKISILASYFDFSVFERAGLCVYLVGGMFTRQKRGLYSTGVVGSGCVCILLRHACQMKGCCLNVWAICTVHTVCVFVSMERGSN